LITEAADGADAAAVRSPNKQAILDHSKTVKDQLRQYKNTSYPVCHRLFHLINGQIKALRTNKQ
jgi:hypothetical protein